LFKKILIANRGEVAVNVINVCKRMKIKTVAIFSDVDKDSMHVKLADEKYCIGPAQATKSYLNAKNIVAIALATGSEAIHPGYGFLSEDFEFAKLCSENNITFIGPTHQVIEKMSDKISAKEIISMSGIAVIEGYDCENSIHFLKNMAQKIGYPVIIKSKHGGGGRGIRVVKEEAELEDSVVEVLQESKQYFNNEQLYMEKYIEDASHIEVQVVADTHGNVCVLGTRDCSIQTNNQKIIEEAPDTKLSHEIRKKIFHMCRKVTLEIGYTNCGTFEFLVDKYNNFYFMELNCRLQVERCVSEAITGIDLIETQIKIAAGCEIVFRQEEISFNGHAIQCRINLTKETGEQNSKFKITNLSIPNLKNVMFKTAIEVNSDVPPFYDSMIGKLIVHGKDRIDAIKKMEKSLDNLIINGIDTNIEIHKKIIKNSDFIKGVHNIKFMNRFNVMKIERLNIYEKVNFLIDENTFEELDKNLVGNNILDFLDYNEKIVKAKGLSKSQEAVVCGEAMIGSMPCILIAMDRNFMMGSMGVVVGEKITRAFEHATEKNLPVIALTVSGGARMQEGIFSLMQMAKTSAAVLKHSEKKLLYISIVTNPTLGGVSASFATLADVIIAEKNTTFGFSGRRIVEEVVRYPLSDDFQSASFNLQHGMVDLILDYWDIKDTIKKILQIHK